MLALAACMRPAGEVASESKAMQVRSIGLELTRTGCRPLARLGCCTHAAGLNGWDLSSTWRKTIDGLPLLQASSWLLGSLGAVSPSTCQLNVIHHTSAALAYNAEAGADSGTPVLSPHAFFLIAPELPVRQKATMATPAAAAPTGQKKTQVTMLSGFLGAGGDEASKESEQHQECWLLHHLSNTHIRTM